MNKGPVFLAGVDRSGIGLLAEVLDMHPNLAISRRTNFWSFFYRRFGDLGNRDNLERCITAMMRYRRIRDLEPSAADLLNELGSQSATYGHLFAALQRQRLRRLGKNRWGDKSINSERYADTIFGEYPDAYMVQVVRDPRDRYASQANHRTAARGKVGSAAALWLWSVKTGERSRRRHGDRYLVIRYEDLVERPHAVLADVCRFIDEEFDDELLMLPTDTVPTPRQFTTNSIGRFRTDLTSTDVAFIEFVAGKKMKNLGYALESQLSGVQRLKFVLLVLPLNLMRMFRWSFARTIGSSRLRPSSRRLLEDANQSL